MRYRIGLWVFVAAVAVPGAFAQTQTPPPVPIPLPNQQSFTNYNNCVMGCDSRAGLCQGGCTVPVVSAAPPAATTRPDIGSQSQCIINCTSQSLTCKQGCTVR